MKEEENNFAGWPDPSSFGPFAPALDYLVDAAQRSVLYWDVLRQRGNQYQEHISREAPHVLSYGAELNSRRPHARTAGELCSRPHHPAKRH